MRCFVVGGREEGGDEEEGYRAGKDAEEHEDPEVVEAIFGDAEPVGEEAAKQHGDAAADVVRGHHGGVHGALDMLGAEADSEQHERVVGKCAHAAHDGAVADREHVVRDAELDVDAEDKEEEEEAHHDRDQSAPQDDAANGEADEGGLLRGAVTARK